MAFNISITKKRRVNWGELLNHCKQLDRDFATIYPIQGNGILDESGIGISINLKSDYSSFWSDFEALLKVLIKDGFQVVELYNGSIVSLEQIDKLKKIIGA
jgi:hypothetical protein